MQDPHKIIGFDVPAADGGNYGHRVLAYVSETRDYVVTPIAWDTGEPFQADLTSTINAHKITYRYALDEKRLSPLTED